ncbi:MAG: lysylphosphatidylglycerol synthase transmembrane domain-containing protein [Bacteroidales bacterium]|nr:lysylphosphatidylglycerol synthase transmembrane domain-containing protein [Bacteroidales bacterium]
MTAKNPLSIFSYKRILLPVLLGVGVASFLIWRDMQNDSTVLVNIIRTWTWQATAFLLLAVLFGIMRDLMYMYRIRLLSDKKLSWKQAFQVIMLWEFGSAITPSVVGGSALAFFIVSLEGIPVGRSTAIVMITALLDELFYIVVTPLVILFIGFQNAFNTEFRFNLLGGEFGEFEIFLLGYGFMCLLTVFILVAIFFFPKGFRTLLYKVATWRLFRRLQDKVRKMGDDIVTSSQEFKHKGFIFWTKAYLCTVFSWTSRFLVLNCILLAFSPIGDQVLAFARQLVMWVILCISPTPGSSGVAELTLPLFLGDFMKEGTHAAIALLWRGFTYYPYLLLGFIVLPYWTKRVFKKNKQAKKQNQVSEN